jgi:hypothetical protein
MLTTSILLLLRDRHPATLFAVGCAMAIAVTTRVTDAGVRTTAARLGAAASSRRRALAAAPLAVGALMYVAYNLSVFDTPVGGYGSSKWFAFASRRHGSWASPLAGGAGTLFSRAAASFSTAMGGRDAVSCFWRPERDSRRRRSSRRCCSTGRASRRLRELFRWWAGWCFGPRYWTEAIPVLGILYALALDAAKSRPWATTSLYAAGALAVGIMDSPRGTIRARGTRRRSASICSTIACGTGATRSSFASCMKDRTRRVHARIRMIGRRLRLEHRQPVGRAGEIEVRRRPVAGALPPDGTVSTGRRLCTAAWDSPTQCWSTVP